VPFVQSSLTPGVMVDEYGQLMARDNISSTSGRVELQPVALSLLHFIQIHNFFTVSNPVDLVLRRKISVCYACYVSVWV
jgi:hypothetical protein